jgi:sec-independent protein translocase protein TatC
VGVSLLRRRKIASADGTMSLMEHLYELRRRLFFAFLAILVGTIIGFIWYTVSVPAIGLRSLGDILIEPYCKVPPVHRAVLGTDPTSCQFLATTPFSQLTVRLQAGVMAGLALSAPVWLYQLWAFVTPALYSKERKFAIIFVSCAALLFASGTVIAYLVIGKALEVLLGFGGSTSVAALSPDGYFSFLLGVLLIFGVSMELPLLLIMLNFVGVLKGERLAKVRRYAWFGLVVFAAFVVPGNDPISMSVLAVVLIVLYEVAVMVAKIHDKRKVALAAEAGFAHLSDDEASPMPQLQHAGGVGPVEAPSPVSTAEPVPVPPQTPPAGDDAAAGPSPSGEGAGSSASLPPRPADYGDAT